MRLRGSSADVDLGAVVGMADPGIPWGKEIQRFVGAVLRGDLAESAAAAQVIETGLGVGALLDVAGVLAQFNGINRLADATGIELEQGVEIPVELGSLRGD